MQWLWIFAGLTLLLAGTILTYWLRHKTGTAAREDSHIPVHYVRLRKNKRAVRLLKKAAGLHVGGKDIEALQEAVRPLMEHLLRLNQEVRRLPALPAGTEGEPRLMDLARDAADQEHFTVQTLLDMLTNWEISPALPQEIAAFPVYVAAAQCQRLTAVLRALLSEARERASAARLAHRLQRCKRPATVLEKNRLNSIGLAELLGILREKEAHQLLALLNAWLESHEISAAAITLSGMNRQIQLAEEIRRARSCFTSLERINWQTYCSKADDLHPLLMHEPSGIYARMTADSQLQLRLQIGRLSRRVRLSMAEVIRQALILCDEAEERSLENYIGYWFQNADGLIALQRALPTRRGWLYAHLMHRRDKLSYAALWGFGIATGFLFLHGRQPVFMLPFFALTVGCVSRYLLDQPTPPKLPAIDLSSAAPDARTLVILYAVLHDPHEAIQAVRRLKTVRHTFPKENVDFLLLGDFTPSITGTSSGDLPIVQAVSSALASMGTNDQTMYLQRARAWDGSAHCYGPRAGLRGAVSGIFRLIAQGECEDTFAYATVEAASFERKYAYVLSLPADYQPAHGMLEHLLQTMAHPLCQRYPTHKGVRGYSLLLPEGASTFDGVGLLRPDSFLEATDGLLPDQLGYNALCGELAGQAQVHGACVHAPREADSWDQQYIKAVSAWKLSPWQLPWVQTPSGLVNNPLKASARFHLREQLRRTLVPLGQFSLLLWAILTENWLLLFLALLAPETDTPFRRPEDYLHFLCRISLLPMRTGVNLTALIQLLRRKSSKVPDWMPLEVWVQGLSATVMAALGFVLPGFAVPIFALSLLFACFSLAHRFLAAPIIPSDPLTDEHIALLESSAASSWRFFLTHVDEASRHLPPCTVQYEPALGADNSTSPEAIGAYLLSCVCAKEMTYLSADEAAFRIRQTLESTAQLSLPFGLPSKRYALPSLTVQDARVDAGGVGFLLCALMTAAQALRTWLPELSTEYTLLSADVTRLADSFDLSRLYDRETMLFHAGLDSNGQGIGHIDTFYDESLLLSIAGCARGDIPPEHLRRLRSTRVALRQGDVPVSRHGTAAAHLLAGLFLPIHEQDAVHFIRAMAERGKNGLFGQGTCRLFAFDPTLRYRQAVFGIPQIASSTALQAPVFAPYAAALCLPFTPHLAGETLVRFRDLGALGPEGFCDAIDLSQGTALVGLHDAYHLGIMFMSASHILADSPMQLYFCALPEVEACLPLLKEERPSLLMPSLPVRRSSCVFSAAPERRAQPLSLPSDSHLMGTEEFHMLADANGCSVMFDGDIPLTRRASADGELQGIQFYLTDEGRIYRLGSALLQGITTFAPGQVRYEQVCGSLRAELTCTVDTLRRRALHMITITNLSTRDRMIELADFLQPDLLTAPDTLEIDRPEKDRLTLHARSTETTLHHTLDASPNPLSVSVCTDASAFLGRGGSLHQPASLEESAYDLLESTAEPCLSFRARLSLGGRGQASIWFTTSLNDTSAPQLHELSGIVTLASLQHNAIKEAASLTETQEQTASRMVSPFFAADAKAAFILNNKDEFDVLWDMIAIANWFHLHGAPVEVSIVFPTGRSEEVSNALEGHVAEASFSIVDEAAFTSSKYRLILRGDVPLHEQAEDLYSSLSPTAAPSKRPIPALLPKKDLLSPCEYGGFDPETSDFIIQLEPGETTPAPWQNRHISRYFTETVDESGFRAPFDEQVWLQMEDGTLLSPWSQELPRAIRIGPGQTDWEAWSDKLDIRLCAAALPGQRCALRVLRLRNATDAPLVLHLSVLARLDAEARLETVPGVIMTNSVSQRMQSFIAGDGWTARRTNAFATGALIQPPLLDAPDSEQGSTALLSYEITLPPHASGKAVWLSGYARHSEDVARALTEVQTKGTSALLRSARAAWTQQLDTLTFDTPEDTLTLLMNRILPMQALCTKDDSGIPALIYLAPKEAKRALLRFARKAAKREEWARLALLTKAYAGVTKDNSLPDVFLSHRGSTLYSCCAEALASLPLDSHGLPLGKNQVSRCFLYAMAAQALDALRPDVSLQELHRKLLNAADTYLWQDGYYGDPLALDVQHLACRAYGSNTRTRQAVQTCWKTLYDQPHGLIRQHEPTEAAPLPGLPQNGGMLTLDAVCFLHALLQTEHADEGFELLRALNPLHHTDDPVRLETFRCAPYQLHGGMCAAPLEAGRAVPEGGSEAAALLYAVVLHDILGFRREGSVIHMKPCVPPDWEDYTITLREGASTWRISAERRIKALTIDGDEVEDDQFSIYDDGKIHRVRFPLTSRNVR